MYMCLNIPLGVVDELVRFVEQVKDEVTSVLHLQRLILRSALWLQGRV